MGVKEYEIIKYISEENIQKKVKKLGEQITQDYKSSKKLTLVTLLEGGKPFSDDLSKQIQNRNLILDYMKASSYGNGTVSSGKVNISQDLKYDIKDCDVIIVDDLIDTGNTLNNIYDMLQKRAPKSLKICTLLNKEERRNPDVKITPDYCGFNVDNEFLVGYGMNYGKKHRSLPYIGIVKFKDD